MLRLVALLILSGFVSVAKTDLPLEAVGVIPLPGVEGRIDHLAADIDGNRLFVSAVNSNSVEVLDVEHRQHLFTIKKQSQPEGIVYLAELDRIVVANSGDGTVRKYDGGTYLLLQSSLVGRDVDNLRVGPLENRVFVGYGSGALASIGINARILFRIRLDGHPESFQLESNGPRIYANIPEAHEVEVVNRDTREVTARWKLANLRRNFAMALDEQDRRLFVLCRQPASLVIMDSTTGAILQKLPCVGDGDDVFYDRARRRIYATGGAGAIFVYGEDHPNHYRLIARIPTASGARTSLFIPEWNTLFVAAPERGNRKAEIRMYKALG